MILLGKKCKNGPNEFIKYFNFLQIKEREAFWNL